MVDLDKFICSFISYKADEETMKELREFGADLQTAQAALTVVARSIKKALAEQGMECKEGRLVPIGLDSLRKDTPSLTQVNSTSSQAEGGGGVKDVVIMKQIDFENELGKSLKELRKNKNLTLRYVEEQTGISNSYLSQLENGKIANPSIFVIYKLSTIYGVSLDDLMSSVISGEGQTENKSNIKHIIEQLKK